MASGYADAVTQNIANLTRLEKCLRLAWLLFVATPFVGLATYAAEPLIPISVGALNTWMRR